jgi:hypothetical protein
MARKIRAAMGKLAITAPVTGISSFLPAPAAAPPGVCHSRCPAAFCWPLAELLRRL